MLAYTHQSAWGIDFGSSFVSYHVDINIRVAGIIVFQNISY